MARSEVKTFTMRRSTQPHKTHLPNTVQCARNVCQTHNCATLSVYWWYRYTQSTLGLRASYVHFTCKDFDRYTVWGTPMIWILTRALLHKTFRPQNSFFSLTLRVKIRWTLGQLHSKSGESSQYFKTKGPNWPLKLLAHSNT